MKNKSGRVLGLAGNIFQQFHAIFPDRDWQCRTSHALDYSSSGQGRGRATKKPPKRLSYAMVNLTTKQVETLFGELEYIEPRLKALGVILADEEVDHV